MKKIIETLKTRRALISDGAWGTFLQAKGLQAGECPELWCLDRRQAVLEIAKSYIDAGADMIETNSFGANSFKLSHYGLANRVAEINEAAASISREAAGTDHFVIASVGPTGVLLVSEQIQPEEVYEAFKIQMVSLERGGANAVCIETFSALDEAGLAVKAARENTGLEVICTFTFEQTVRGEYRTIMGVSPEQMALSLSGLGTDIIGSNCGNGMRQMADIVRRIRAAAPDIPVLVHANAGLPVRTGNRDIFPDTPGQMAEAAKEVCKAGANIIGGCCGTTPAHIRALAAALV